MKSLAKRLFPHPVLSKSNDDFKDSVFDAGIELSDKSSDSSWTIDVKWELKNDDLIQLIEENKIAVSLHFECGSTRFRSKWISDNNLPISAEISDSNIKLQGEYAVVLVALEDINTYHETSFHPDYSNTDFKIEKGDILGVGDFGVISFTAAEDPVSFFRINNDPKIQSGLFNVDYNEKNINVNLSGSLYEKYYYLKNSRELWPVLNSIFILPVLIQVLNYMDEMEEDDEHSTSYWYLQLSKKLKGLKDLNDLDTNLFKAQKILNKMVEEALANLDNNDIDGEEDDS